MVDGHSVEHRPHPIESRYTAFRKRYVPRHRAIVGRVTHEVQPTVEFTFEESGVLDCIIVRVRRMWAAESVAAGTVLILELFHCFRRITNQLSAVARG